MNRKEKFIPDGFIEAKKFIELVNSIATNFAGAERAFSNLKMVKSYLRNRQSTSRTEALLRMYKEKDITSELLENETQVRSLVRKILKKIEF